MLIEFKGMMYDTEKWYINRKGRVVRVISADEYRMFCKGRLDDYFYTTNHLDSFDISKIALPEKKKIIPEKGKVYKVSIWEQGETYYLEFDGTHFCNDETRLHHSLTIVLAEMKEA